MFKPGYMKVEALQPILSVMIQPTNYDSLRSWYLARLRKSAIEAQVSGQLTPSALIAADREVIEKLIAERTEADEKNENVIVKNSGNLKFAFLLWLYLILSALLSLYLFCLGDASILSSVLAVSMNPGSLSQTNSSTPNMVVMLVVQSVFYVYPITVFPYILFMLKQDGR